MGKFWVSLWAVSSAIVGFNQFLLFALSDALWKDVITAVQTILLAIITPLSAWAILTLNRIAKTGEKSHDLANSFMLAQKKKLAETSRMLANATNDPGHIAKAEVEEAAYEAHRLTDERMRAAGKIAD